MKNQDPATTEYFSVLHKPRHVREPEDENQYTKKGEHQTTNGLQTYVVPPKKKTQKTTRRMRFRDFKNSQKPYLIRKPL